MSIPTSSLTADGKRNFYGTTDWSRFVGSGATLVIYMPG